MTDKNFDDLAVEKVMFPVPDVNHCQSLYHIKWIMIALHSITFHYIPLNHIVIFWLVVWNMNFMFSISWEFHHPN